MQLIALLLPILSLVCFAAFIWLVVVAFRKSTLWGVLVLLLSPITAIIFAVKNWDESRRPFTIYAGSIVASFVLMIAAFGSLGGFAMMAMADRMQDGDVSDEEVAQFIGQQMDRLENTGMLDDEERKSLDEMRLNLDNVTKGEPADGTRRLVLGGGGVSPSPAGSPVPPIAAEAGSILPAVAEAAPAIPLGDIHPREAHRLIGRWVEVHEKSGREYKGTLIEVKPQGLVLERHLKSGSMTYELVRNDVRSLAAVNPY